MAAAAAAVVEDTEEVAVDTAEVEIGIVEAGEAVAEAVDTVEVVVEATDTAVAVAEDVAAEAVIAEDIDFRRRNIDKTRPQKPLENRNFCIKSLKDSSKAVLFFNFFNFQKFHSLSSYFYSIFSKKLRSTIYSYFISLSLALIDLLFSLSLISASPLENWIFKPIHFI